MKRKPYATMRKAVEKAEARHNAAVNAVYAFAPNGQTKFWDCYALASDTVKHEHDQTTILLDAARHEAVNQGTAYFGTFGMLTFYK
jgi:hypothetical protein